MDKNHHPKSKDWREICKQAACELNPEKLMDLIAQLTKALDERNPRREVAASNDRGGGRRSWQDEPVV